MPRFDMKTLLVWLLRAASAVVILAVGLLVMQYLAQLRQPPEQRARQELPIPVIVQPATAAPITLQLEAYGTVRSATVARIGSEISGRVADIWEKLQPGQSVAADTLLVRLDTSSLDLQKQAAMAQLRVLDAQLGELQQQLLSQQELLALRRQRRAIVQTDVGRRERLLEQEGVGSQAELDQARRQLLEVDEQLHAITSAIDLLPRQVATVEARQQQLHHEIAVHDDQIARGEIRAPLAGRLLEVHAEVGRVVTTGMTLLTIVDDSHLELAVSLDGSDVAHVLRFAARSTERPGGWFPPPEELPVQIYWLGGQDRGDATQLPATTGTLDRLQEYDGTNRTVTAIVRIPAPGDEGDASRLPLVPGMFCKVVIPGKVIHAAIRLPRVAVTDRGTVHVVRDGRLDERQVSILHQDGDSIIIAPELPAETQIVVNRLTTAIIGQAVEIRAAATPRR